VLAVDTNILVRLVLGDDLDHSGRAKECVVRAHHEGRRLYVAQAVIQELFWVLLNNRGVSRTDAVRAVDGLLTMPVWEVEAPARIAHAIRIFEEHKVDFTDALLAAISHEKGLEGVLSFDRDMGRIGARWVRP
jgi:predicted nucleic-acid-binding protein